MTFPKDSLRRLFFCYFLIFTTVGVYEAKADNKTQEVKKLKGVVVLSRHGIRAPHLSSKVASGYGDLVTKKDWPGFKAKPDDLTERGALLAKGMGGFYARHYLPIVNAYGADPFMGPFPGDACQAINTTYSVADNAERTIKTAENIAAGFGGGNCKEAIFHGKENGKKEALFHPVKAGFCAMNTKKAQAAQLTQVGVSTVKEFRQLPVYKVALKTTQQLTDCCKASLCSGDKSCSLSKIDESKRPDYVLENLGETFVLRYTNGQDVGLDQKMTAADWAAINEFHSLAHKMKYRPFEVAKHTGAGLTQHILMAIEALATQEKPQIIFIVGHDDNMDAVASLMEANWKLYRPEDKQSKQWADNQTPPTSALMFEVYEDAKGKLTLEGSFATQTMDQMHEGITADTMPGGPMVVPVAFGAKGCHGNKCDMSVFVPWVRERFVKGCVTSDGKA